MENIAYKLSQPIPICIIYIDISPGNPVRVFFHQSVRISYITHSCKIHICIFDTPVQAGSVVVIGCRGNVISIERKKPIIRAIINITSETDTTEYIKSYIILKELLINLPEI